MPIKTANTSHTHIQFTKKYVGKARRNAHKHTHIHTPIEAECTHEREERHTQRERTQSVTSIKVT